MLRIRRRKEKERREEPGEDMRRESKYELFRIKKAIYELAELTIKGGVLKGKPDPSKYRLLERYTVRAPFSRLDVNIEIWQHEKTGKIVYCVREPPLNEKERAVYTEIQHIFMYTDIGIEDFSDKDKVLRAARAKLEELIAAYCGARGEGVDPEKIKYYCMRDVVGFSVIDPIMRDPNIEDVSCSGPNIPIFVWHRRYEYIQTNIVFNAPALDAFVIKLANMAGKHISTANPILDAILPGGHRLAATFRREVSSKGSSFTIRRFREDPITIVDMVNWRTIPLELAAYFWILMEHRMCGLILGVTGAGKTSTLNALATMLKPSMKVVTIEDTPELRLPLKNWVQLVSRPSYGEGGREITLFDLVKISLRYRPDVIIVGEIRGEEAYVLFQSMASVSRDTPILIKDRDGRVQLVKIGDFVDRFYSDPSEEWVPKEVDGYWVLSHDGFRAVWRPIKYVLRHRASEVYRIEVEGGGTIRATASHSVFVLDPETLDIKVKEVKDLRPGDLLVTFVKRGADDGNALRDPVLGDIDGDLAFAMGLYLADGCVKEHRGSRIVISVGVTKYGMMERVVDTMWSKFMMLPTVDDRGSYRIYEFCNTAIAKRFGELLGRRLAEKKIPQQIWSSSRDVVREFLEGYAADSRRTLKRRYKAYITANKDLAVELIWLARLNGWYSFLSRERGTGKNVGRTYYTVAVYLDEGRVSRKPNAAERVPSRALVKLFELASISMPLEFTRLRRRAFASIETAKNVIEYVRRRGRLSEEARRLIERIEAYISGDLRAVKVKRVEKESYNDFVYDLSVPGTESFFGGDVPVLLHNTGHGGITTMHAENIDAAVKRLTSPPMNIPQSYIPLVNFALLIRRVEIGKRIARRVTNVWEVLDYGKYVDIARWSPRTDRWEIDLSKSSALRKVAELRGWDFERVLKVEVPLRTALLRYLALTSQRDYRTVADHVYAFYADPRDKARQVHAECVKLAARDGRFAEVARMIEEALEAWSNEEIES